MLTSAVDSFCGSGEDLVEVVDVEFDGPNMIVGGHTNSPNFFNLTADSLDFFVLQCGGNFQAT